MQQDLEQTAPANSMKHFIERKVEGLLQSMTLTQPNVHFTSQKQTELKEAAVKANQSNSLVLSQDY